MCPGGGAEIFADRVHQEGYHLKNTGDEWLETARTVHQAGCSNCTMLHGHIETIEERVDHLDRLRLLQDETGGFQTYIPLSFHPENTSGPTSPARPPSTSCARSPSRASCSTTSRTSRPTGS